MEEEGPEEGEAVKEAGIHQGVSSGGDAAAKTEEEQDGSGGGVYISKIY